MEKVKILAIAPYEGMKEVMQNISKFRTDYSLTVRVGNLDEGVQIVKSMDRTQYDVIVSRGGTLDLIRKFVDVPAVDIMISMYDILRAIKLAENYTEKFAIVGYPSITDTAKILCDLLQYDLNIFTLTPQTDVKSEMARLQNMGYGMVLCDVIGYTSAKQIGMNSILITSGSESVESAFNRAIELHHHISKLTTVNRMLQHALESSDNETFILNREGNLLYSSTIDPVEKEFSLSLITNSFKNMFAPTEVIIDKKSEGMIYSLRSKLSHLDNEDYLYVYVSKKYPPIADDESILVENNSDPDQDTMKSFNSLGYIGDIKEKLHDYGKTALPVLILGEPGTGKDRAASIIYEVSPFSNNPFYTIDCALLNDKKWRYIFEHESSPLNNVHMTIYFKNILSLSSEQAAQLISHIDGTKLAMRDRLIFSMVCKDISVPCLPLCDYLTNQLSCLIITLNPLRHRKDDIPNLATLYINLLNASLVKEIVGFEPNAMELLQNHSWLNNLDQFKRVVREIVVSTKTPYITAESVKTALKNDLHIASYNLEGQVSIDITQPLNEITYDIVRMVLQEEDMNQVKTAQRLGISRSTLWRMLKSKE